LMDLSIPREESSHPFFLIKIFPNSTIKSHTIMTNAACGPLYTADEIDRLYHAPKPE
jgi:hypothetical protein